MTHHGHEPCGEAAAGAGPACLIMSYWGSRLRTVSRIDELEVRSHAAKAELEAYSATFPDAASAQGGSFEERAKLGRLRQAAFEASLRLVAARTAVRLNAAARVHRESGSGS